MILVVIHYKRNFMKKLALVGLLVLGFSFSACVHTGHHCGHSCKDGSCKMEHHKEGCKDGCKMKHDEAGKTEEKK